MKRSLFLLAALCFAAYASEIDMGRARHDAGKVETVQIDGRNAVRVTSSPDRSTSERNYGFKVKPGSPYRLTVRISGKDLKPRPGKNMKGAGINLVADGKIIYRGSHLGRWKHALGTFDGAKLELSFKSGKSDMLYLYLQVSEADGSAEFYDLTLDEGVPAPKPPAPSAGPGKPGTVSYRTQYGQIEDLTEDGRPVIRVTVPPGKTHAYRNFTISVEPGKNYVLSVYLRGKDLTELPSKSLKGAGISLTGAGKTIYRGSHLGLWKHAKGTFGWTKMEVPFKAPAAKEAYVSLEVADATGMAEFSGLSCSPAVPAGKKTAPQLDAELFPVDYQKGVYYIARNMPATLNLKLKGTRQPVAPRLELDLPEGVACLGASPLWPVDEKAAVWTYAHDTPVTAAVTRDGKKYTRYTLVIGKPALRRFKAWRNDYRVYLASPKASGTAFWRLCDGKFSGAWKKFELRDAGSVVYPARRMEKFHLMIDYPMNFYGGMPEMARLSCGYWLKLDTRPWTKAWHIAWRHLPEERRKRHREDFTIGVSMSVFGSMPRFNFESWLKKNDLPHKYRLQVPRHAGAPREVLCPQAIIDDPDGVIWDRFAPEGIRGYCAGLVPRFVEFDFEPGAMGYCFCEVCRAKFSTPVKTKEEILSKHRKAWFQFRLRQHADVARKFNQMVAKHFPGSLAVMCTDPLHVGAEPLAEWCGVDPRLFDKDGVQLYQNMPYFEGAAYFDSMELNVKTLTGAPHFPLVDPTEEMERYYVRYTPGGVKTVMLACAANGGIGQGFYPSDYFDGRYFVSIAEGADLIAKAEDFYMKGKRRRDGVSWRVLNMARHSFTDNGREVTVESPDFRPTTRSTIHEHDGKLLLTLFNYHPRSAVIAKLEPPAGMYGNELNSGRALGAERTVKVPAGGVVLVEFSKTPYDLPVMPSFDRELANFKSEKPVGDYGMLMPEKAVLPKLGLDKYAIYVDPDAGANVVGWTSPDGADPLRSKDRGYLGDFIPEKRFASKAVSYRITAPGCFEYRVPPPDDANPDADPCEGLIVRKRYRLEDGGKTLAAEFEVENANPRKTPMKLKVRVRNIPKIGGKVAGGKALTEVIRVNGESVVAFSKSRPLDGKPVTVGASDAGMSELMTFLPDKSFTSVSCWSTSGDVYTVEPETDGFTLPFGAVKKFSVKYRIAK